MGSAETHTFHLPAPAQAPSRSESFTSCLPFSPSPRSQWRPEESEDYVSNRCASGAKPGSGWARGTLPLPTIPPSLSRQNPQGTNHILRKLVFRL